MKCPKCRVPMLVVEYDGIELDYCVECAGTWFDRGELALLFEGVEADSADHLQADHIASLPEASTAEARRPCPICRRKMRKANIGPQARVMIDACRSGHGLWFDGNEVAQLARDLAGASSSIPDRALAFLGRMFGTSDSTGKPEEEDS